MPPGLLLLTPNPVVGGKCFSNLEIIVAFSRALSDFLTPAGDLSSTMLTAVVYVKYMEAIRKRNLNQNVHDLFTMNILFLSLFINSL